MSLSMYVDRLLEKEFIIIVSFNHVLLKCTYFFFGYIGTDCEIKSFWDLPYIRFKLSSKHSNHYI